MDSDDFVLLLLVLHGALVKNAENEREELVRVLGRQGREYLINKAHKLVNVFENVEHILLVIE